MGNQTENAKSVNGFSYHKTDSNNHIKSNQQKDINMVSQTDNKLSLSLIHRNKQIQVTLEFPEQSDRKAEHEFIARLKEIYLKKVENRAMQKEDFALPSPTTKEKEEKDNE